MDQHLLYIANQLPFTAVKGDGPFLCDPHGFTYIDMWNDNGVASMGYSSGIVEETISNFLALKAPHRAPLMVNTAIREAYSKAICAEVGMDRVFYANGGSDAVESAIKLARLYQYKENESCCQNGIATISHNYHGATGFALAANDDHDYPYRKDPFYGPHQQTTFIEGFCAMDEEFNLDYGGGGDRRLREEQIGAVILAPIPADYTAINMRSPEWHAALRRWCDDHGALLIHDDVQAGAGRCGYFASWKHPSIGAKPDIVTLGKGVAMGFPLSLCLATGKVAAAMEPGRHYCTMAGGDLLCYCAHQLLRWYQDGGGEHVRGEGEWIKAKLAAKPWIRSVHGTGYMLGFTPDYLGYSSGDFATTCYDIGLIIAKFRPYGMLRFGPALNASREILVTSLEIMDEARKRVAC